MTDDQFYEIWNRACTGNAGPDPLAGDLALTQMVHGYSYIMNGGLEHFADLTEDEQREAINGFRFFSFHDVADLISKVPTLSETALGAAHASFCEFDSVMMVQIRKYIEAHPHQFSSL